MKKIKFVHCADFHIDAPMTHLKDSELSKKKREDIFEAFMNTIEYVKKSRADILLISGDLYEHKYIRKSVIIKISTILQSIAPIPVVIIPGNHDPYFANAYYKTWQWPENVIILEEPFKNKYIKELGVNVYGVGFNSFSQDIDKRHTIEIDEESVNIMLFHGNVDFPLSDKGYNNIESEWLNDLHMDYYALGHFHNRNDSVSNLNNFSNPGSPEPLGFDEPGIHGIYYGEIEKINNETQVKLEFVPIAKREYIEWSIDISDIGMEMNIIKEIKAYIDSVDKKNIIKIILTGFIEEGFTFSLDKIKEELINKCFSISILNHTRPKYDLEKMSNEIGLKGLFVKKMLENIKKAKNEKEEKIATNALYYGLNALDDYEIIN